MSCEPTDTEELAAAGRAARDSMHAAWQGVIRDPARGLHDYAHGRIEEFYRTGLGWNVSYLGDGFGQEWCGAAAMYVWADSLKIYWRKYFGASTDRLDSFGAYRPWQSSSGMRANPEPQLGESRRVYLKMDRHSTPGWFRGFVKPQ